MILSVPHVLHVRRSIEHRPVNEKNQRRGWDGVSAALVQRWHPFPTVLHRATLVPHPAPAASSSPQRRSASVGHPPKRKQAQRECTLSLLLAIVKAEGEGFEPPVPQRGTPVFETGAFSQAPPPFRLLEAPPGALRVDGCGQRGFLQKGVQAALNGSLAPQVPFYASWRPRASCRNDRPAVSSRACTGWLLPLPPLPSQQSTGLPGQ